MGTMKLRSPLIGGTQPYKRGCACTERPPALRPRWPGPPQPHRQSSEWFHALHIGQHPIDSSAIRTRLTHSHEGMVAIQSGLSHFPRTPQRFGKPERSKSKRRSPAPTVAVDRDKRHNSAPNTNIVMLDRHPISCTKLRDCDHVIKARSARMWERKWLMDSQ